MRRPELRGRPVVVAGSGPRAVVTTASYEARHYGVVLRHPRRPRAAAVPGGDFIPPDFEAYRAMSKRVMDRVRAQVETVEVDRPRRGLPRAHRARRRRAPPCAAWSRRSRPTPGSALGRHRPEPAGGQGRLRRREAAGLRRAHPRAGVRALRRRAAAAAARHRRRRPPSGSSSSGSPPSRRLAATPPGDADASASAAAWARTCCARARFEDDSPVSSERIAVSESRETTFNDRHRRPRRAGRGAAAADRPAVRGPGQARAARAHDRHQGPARRLHDRHPRPHDPGRHQRPAPWSATSPARCSTSTRRRGRCGCSACAWRPSRRTRRGRGDAADVARPLDLGPIATGGRDRPRGIMRRMTTDTRTASQIITDEVTSWPGAEAGSAAAASTASRSGASSSATCTATTSSTSASPRPCGRSSTTPAASTTTRSSRTRRAGPRAGSRATTTSATSSRCCGSTTSARALA